MKKRRQRQLMVEVLQMALGSRQVQYALIYHTGRSSQYARSAYQGLRKTAGIHGRMSRRGCCDDNAVWPNDPLADESFFSILKKEQVYRGVYATREEAHLSLFGYIEGWYNPGRIHSSLDYRSPMTYEKKHYSRERAQPEEHHPEELRSLVTA